MIITKVNDSKYKNLVSNIIYKKKTLNKLYNYLRFEDNSINQEIKINFCNNNSLKLYVEKIYKIVTYIISMQVTKSNIILNIQNMKGSVLINTTAGKLGFKGSQKNKKFSLLSLLKNINYNYNFLNNQPVILKLKGFKYYNRLIIKKFKEKFKIKMLIYNNSIPQNGCRPKKKKENKSKYNAAW